MTTDTINIAICGFSPSTHTLVRMHRSIGFKIVAVWENSSSEAVSIAEKLGIERHSHDLDDILTDPDIHIILACCPPQMQPAVVEKIISSGKTVICSLPFGIDSRPLKDLSMKVSTLTTPSVCLLGHGLRFQDGVKRMREMVVKEGALGQLYICEAKLVSGPLVGDRYDWTCDSQMGGGLLNIYGALVIDLIYYVTGRRLSRVNGSLKTYTRQTDNIRGIRHITADDFCVINGELEISERRAEPNGTLANMSLLVEESASVLIQMNCFAPIGEFDLELTLIGSQGRLTLRGSDLFQCLKPAVQEEKIIDDPLYPDLEHKLNGEFSLVEGESSPHLPPLLMKGWLRMLSALSDHYLGRSDCFNFSSPTLEDWALVQRDLQCIRLAAKRGSWVNIGEAMAR